MTFQQSHAADNNAPSRRSSRTTPKWDKPINVTVENVVKSYGKTFAIKDVSLDIRRR